MNTPTDDALDDRLRKSDPAGRGVKVPAARQPHSPRNSNNLLRDWWLTTSRRARRSLVGGVGVTAAALIIVAGTLSPANGPLIVLADSPNPQPAAESSAVSDSKMMMPFVNYEYVAGDNLSISSGRGHVYRLNLDGTPESVLQRAATYFGVTGAPQKSQYFDPNWPTYVVGPEDGTSPSVTVSWTGTGSWWYSNPAAYPEQACLHEHRVGKGSDAYVECTEYEPAITGLNPNESDTRRLASEFFKSMGVSFDDADITVMVDEWSSYASIAIKVAGQPTAIEWSMSWSGNGEISWAQGNSVSIVDAGEFGTVSDAAAVDRLADWRWFGSGPTSYQAGMRLMKSSVEAGIGVAEGDVAPSDTSDTTEPTDPTTDPTAEPSSEPTQDPAPVDTAVPEPTDTAAPVVEPSDSPTAEPTEPEIPVKTITIDKAESALLLVWDASGDAWLVPGVALTGVDSWWQTVITLVDGVIELPPASEPIPID